MCGAIFGIFSVIKKYFAMPWVYIPRKIYAGNAARNGILHHSVISCVQWPRSNMC